MIAARCANRQGAVIFIAIRIISSSALLSTFQNWLCDTYKIM